MDPYLERYWPDVHLALVAEARRVLNRALPEGSLHELMYGVPGQIRVATNQSPRELFGLLTTRTV